MGELSELLPGSWKWGQPSGVLSSLLTGRSSVLSLGQCSASPLKPPLRGEVVRAVPPALSLQPFVALPAIPRLFLPSENTLSRGAVPAALQ